MKGAAELLGVSYGTLYGRYRENFGYLKHAWNISGRPQKKPDLFSEPGTKAILDSMRAGNITVKQAAEALGMDAGMLAYQLAGKVSSTDSFCVYFIMVVFLSLPVLRINEIWYGSRS